MQNIRKIFLFLALGFFFSCEEQELFINCNDCFKEEPVETDLEIRFDLYSGRPTLIKVYEGNLEDNILYRSFDALSTSRLVTVPINKKYTVTATYFIMPHYYTAVSSATPRVRFYKNRCSGPCFLVYDKSIDLKLKYHER